MNVGGESGAAGAWRNEMIADNGEGRDEPLQSGPFARFRRARIRPDRRPARDNASGPGWRSPLHRDTKRRAGSQSRASNGGGIPARISRPRIGSSRRKARCRLKQHLDTSKNLRVRLPPVWMSANTVESEPEQIGIKLPRSATSVSDGEVFGGVHLFDEAQA